MKSFHIPRKRFGQHFLSDRQIISRIVQSIHPQPDDALIEIGPGQGALTLALLPHVKKMTLIELDRDLVPFLKSLSSSEHQVDVVAADALKVDIASLQKNSQLLRIIGNLPYNISTPLIFHLLNYAHCISDMVFMLQKEVVSRLAAQPGTSDYGRLSVMVQYHCHCEFLFDVPPHSFSPPPKVNSAMVRLTPLKDPLYKAQDEKMLALIVRTAFSARRKTLRNALKELVSQDIFDKLEINSQRRPEELSVGEFVALANILSA